MGMSQTDIKLRYLLQFGLKAIRSNPEKYCAEIFEDSSIPALNALYGKTSQQAAKWIKETEVPIVLGYDLVDAKMPCITVHISGSSPQQPLMGDEGLVNNEQLEYQEVDVIVPHFQLAGIDATNPKAYKITLPETMPFETKELFIPGLKVRDPKSRLYTIAMNGDGDLFLTEYDSEAPLSQIDLTSLEVVSPIMAARMSQGSMVYRESVTITVHGMSNRNEGLWLSYMVQWILLKFRPLMIGTLSLDLGMPSVSDLSREDSMREENVWRRYFSMDTTTVVTWNSYRQQDILGLLLTIKDGQVGTP